MIYQRARAHTHLPSHDGAGGKILCSRRRLVGQEKQVPIRVRREHIPTMLHLGPHHSYVCSAPTDTGASHGQRLLTPHDGTDTRPHLGIAPQAFEKDLVRVRGVHGCDYVMADDAAVWKRVVNV